MDSLEESKMKKILTRLQYLLKCNLLTWEMKTWMFVFAFKIQMELFIKKSLVFEKNVTPSEQLVHLNVEL